MTAYVICVARIADSRSDPTCGDDGSTRNRAKEEADFSLPRNESARPFVAALR